MKAKIINIKIGNKENIKNSLEKYRYFINNDLITRDEIFFQHFNIIFLDENNEKLKIDNLSYKGKGIVKEYLNLCPSNESLNEVLFFAYALEIEELKEEILNTLKDIVKYSREKNDTNNMWIGEDSVFGLGPIYIFSRYYDQYSYLLGAYLIPYWDEEHAQYVIDLLINYTTSKGICRETLKIFAYSDNSSFRRSIFGEKYIWSHKESDYIINRNYKSLKKWFRENKKDYEWFKETLMKRFNEYDYIQYSEDTYEEHPIDDFYLTLLGEFELTDEFNEFFIYDTCDIEAKELEEKIINNLGKPLVKKIEEENDNYYYKGECIEKWKKFIVDYFGYHIWSYVEKGGSVEILNDIEGINGKELLSITKKSYDFLYKEIKYYVGAFDSVEEEIHNIFGNLFYDLYNEYEYIEVGKINLHNGSNYQLIRFVDFIYYLFSKKPFARDFVDFVVEEYKLLSIVQFEERYCENFQDKFVLNSKEFFSMHDEAYGDELEKLYRDFNQLRDENALLAIDTLDKFKMFDLYGFDYNQINYRWMLFRAYILSKDIENKYSDEVTLRIKKDFDNDFLESFLEKIKIASNPELLREYEELKDIIYYKPKMPSQELMMKVMRVGINNLDGNEKEIIMNFKDAKVPSTTGIKELIENMLLAYLDNGKTKYRIFDDDNVKIYMQIIYLISKAYYNSFEKNKIKGFEKLELLLNTFVHISPIIVIEIFSKLWRQKWREFNDEILGIIDFKESLKKFKIPEESFFAWHFEYANRNSNKELESLIDILGNIDEEEENSFFGGINRKKKEYAHRALDKINLDIKIKVLESVQEKYGIDTELKNTLLSLLKIQIEDVLVSQDQCQLILNDYTNAIYNGLIKDFNGDFDYIIKEKILNREEILNKLNDYTEKYHIFFEKRKDSYKLYGHKELLGPVLKAEEYSGYFPYDSKIIITDNIGEVINKKKIVEEIYEYLTGKKEFEEIEKYKVAFRDYISRGDNNLEFSFLLNKLDKEIFIRFIRLLNKGKIRNLNEEIEKVLMYNLEFFDRVNEIISLENMYEIVANLLKKIEIEEINYINNRISVVEVIQKQNSKNRLRILTRLKEYKLSVYTEPFKNDESRLIRDLFNY